MFDSKYMSSARLHSSSNKKITDSNVLESSKLFVSTTDVQKLFNVVGSAAFAIDNNSIITSWSSEAKTLFGYTKKEIVGKDISYLYLQDSVGMRIYKGKNGGHFSGDTIMLPLIDENGLSNGCLVYIKDVKSQHLENVIDRQKAEILESITDAFFSLDKNWNFTYVNTQAGKLLFRRKEELLGRNIWNVFGEAVGTTFYTKYFEAFNTQKPVHFEEFYSPLHSWFQVSAYPSKDGLSIFFANINERKEAEEALKRSEARLRKLVEADVVGIIFWNINGKVTQANDAFLSMTGYSREDLESGAINWTAMTPPEYKDLDAIAVRELFQTGRHAPFEKEYIRKDGSRIHVVLGNTFFDEKKEEGAGFVLDITEQKKIEKELLNARDESERSRRLYEAVTGSSIDLIYVFDLQYRCIYANDALLNMWGEPRDEYIGKRLSELGYEPWHAEIHEREIDQVISTKKPIRGEVSFLHATLGRRIYDYIFTPILNDAGEVEAIAGTTRDISDLKQNEFRMEEAARLSSLNADIGAALTTSDEFDIVLFHCADALVKHLDAAFARIWLLDEPHEILELKASAGIYTHLDGKYSKIKTNSHKIGEIATSGKPYCINDVLQEPGIENHTWAKKENMKAFAGYPLVVENKIIGVVAVFSKNQISQNAFNVMGGSARMISLGIKRRFAENELKKLNSDLEKKVEERTYQLSTANKELELSNRELQDFAYVASHDLQEPLRKIAAFSNLLLTAHSDELSDDSQKYLGIIQKAARRMSTLLNDLLTFSRVTTKAQPFEEVNLTELARQAIDDLQVRIEQAHAEVVLKDLGFIEGDKLQIGLLFLNLISNAIKYQPEGNTPKIKIYSKAVKGFNTIYVKDNGIGFDEKYLDKIFTIFQRLHGKDAYEGTGVGLAICKKIVDRHGGIITAKSSEGAGSTFVVKLPRKH